MIAALQQDTPWQLAITDFQARLPAPGVALATFRTAHADGSEPALRSSIWALEEGRWRLRFHQDKPINP